VGRGERLAGKIRERIEEDLLLVSVGADWRKWTFVLEVMAAARDVAGRDWLATSRDSARVVMKK
jgi:hypothetical protein